MTNPTSADLRTGVHAMLTHQGYTLAEIEAAESAPHTPACECGPNGWDCMDEDGRSRHPLSDEIDNLAELLDVAMVAIAKQSPERHPDRPITARAALLAFADELDDILDPAVIPPATIATITHMARERARSLPDQPPTVEHPGVPALDVDQQLRVHALDAAARVWHGVGGDLPDKGLVVRHAGVFEAYLRGGR